MIIRLTQPGYFYKNIYLNIFNNYIYNSIMYIFNKYKIFMNNKNKYFCTKQLNKCFHFKLFQSTKVRSKIKN